MKVRVLWYNIDKREFQPSSSNTTVTKVRAAQGPKASSISNLEAPCEGHDIVRVDLTLNRLQSRQIRAIQSLDRCSEQRVIPIQRDVGNVLPFSEGRGPDRVRALPYGGSDDDVVRG